MIKRITTQKELNALTRKLEAQQKAQKQEIESRDKARYTSQLLEELDTARQEQDFETFVQITDELLKRIYNPDAKCAPHYWNIPQPTDSTIICLHCGRSMDATEMPDFKFRSIRQAVKQRQGDAVAKALSAWYEHWTQKERESGVK